MCNSHLLLQENRNDSVSVTSEDKILVENVQLHVDLEERVAGIGDRKIDIDGCHNATSGLASSPASSDQPIVLNDDDMPPSVELMDIDTPAEEVPSEDGMELDELSKSGSKPAEPEIINLVSQPYQTLVSESATESEQLSDNLPSLQVIEQSFEFPRSFLKKKESEHVDPNGRSVFNYFQISTSLL